MPHCLGINWHWGDYIFKVLPQGTYSSLLSYMLHDTSSIRTSLHIVSSLTVAKFSDVPQGHLIDRH